MEDTLRYRFQEIVLQWAGLRGDTAILMSPVCRVLLLSALAVEEGFLQWVAIVDEQIHNWLNCREEVTVEVAWLPDAPQRIMGSF